MYPAMATATASSIAATATASSIAERLTLIEAQLETSKNEINTMFLLWAATLVFLMQAGFALLSAGSIRAKNGARACLL